MCQASHSLRLAGAPNHPCLGLLEPHGPDPTPGAEGRAILCPRGIQDQFCASVSASQNRRSQPLSGPMPGWMMSLIFTLMNS